MHPDQDERPTGTGMSINTPFNDFWLIAVLMLGTMLVASATFRDALQLCETCITSTRWILVAQASLWYSIVRGWFEVARLGLWWASDGAPWRQSTGFAYPRIKDARSALDRAISRLVLKVIDSRGQTRLLIIVKLIDAGLLVGIFLKFIQLSSHCNADSAIALPIVACAGAGALIFRFTIHARITDPGPIR